MFEELLEAISTHRLEIAIYSGSVFSAFALIVLLMLIFEKVSNMGRDRQAEPSEDGKSDHKIFLSRRSNL